MATSGCLTRWVCTALYLASDIAPPWGQAPGHQSVAPASGLPGPGKQPSPRDQTLLGVLFPWEAGT